MPTPPGWLLRPISLGYLALVAIIGPLLILSVNLHRIPVSNALLGAGLLFGGLLVIRLVLALLVRRPAVTDPLLALATIGLLYNGLAGTERSLLLLAAWIAIVLGLAGAVVLVPRYRPGIERALVIFLGVLVATLSFNVVTSPIWGQRDGLSARFAAAFPAVPVAATPDAARPDIYYIVFDRYARADVLAERYQFDNSAFLSALEARGFAVAPQAVGAYQRTAHSLASTLNLDYLPQIGASSDWVPLYDTLSRPRLFTVLDRLGYDIETLGSWWEPTRQSAIADSNDSFYAIPESLRPFSEVSLLSGLLSASGVGILDARIRHCLRIRDEFADLAKGGDDRPQFVFAHLLVPHPPFVIDASGACRSVADASEDTRVENYIAQVRYTNDAALTMIDAITARDPDAIIVLQSDEGLWPAEYAGEEIIRFGADVTTVDWERVDPDDLREKMSILSAIRFPGHDAAVAAPDFAPVNTFRAILREQFGLDLPDRARQALVFKTDAALYDYLPVLDILEAERPTAP
jgi:hypothetical protein